MSNTISQRIYDFLKEFPPFNVLEKNQLQQITSHIRVIYLEIGQSLFSQGDMPHKHFYVVGEGAIELYKRMEEDSILIDICDEGDVFGLRPLIQNDNYLMSALAKEESIIYAIPIEIFKEIVKTNDKANKFLIASFSTNIKNPYSKNVAADLFANDTVLKKSALYFDSQLATYSTNPVTCKENTSIKEAAQLMTKYRVGSIVIEENKKPKGIITDKDLRSKIATGIVSINKNTKEIMSTPVITVADNITVAEAQIRMLQHTISHLCVTKTGTRNSEIKGILSEHDIVVLRGNNPSAIIKKINRAQDTAMLKLTRQNANILLPQYLKQETSIRFISNIISEINKAVTLKAIELSLKEMDDVPPAKFAWLALGSQGRNEQLLMTDQDNALIFQDVDQESYAATKTYFLGLSKKVTEKLNTIGFEYCPSKMMASNPKWCLSLNEWKNQFIKWIQTPSETSIMMCTIFFDYNFLFGDKELSTELSQSIFKSIDSYEIFLNYLGRNALLNPPPIGFFRQLIVESDGENKDQFDLKARTLMPLIDAARLLILSHKIIDKNNTIERYQTLADLEPQNKELYESCIESFKILKRYQLEQGLTNENSGRYLKLKTLGKAEKLRLKGCFKAIKNVQELINTRYRLSQIM
ncbi:CBS domain-containing protein [Gillisia sp. Hel_I_86]|uniref:DUF294 nucleotidyltransferase-like domain-containing protein n=1 Tax=Gillisia sp. Hel_I_86 TaxID=1249981 RepID=UPI001198FED4|nr:DUF294 nucleotidyltransferase-like domain-containing protein [Gillisia sp. Hel_I_86]TVZ28296.1 CBS domain-containing protein [Gillisia sp. Hel_I_86]